MISNAKYGSRGILPELHTIPEGALRGFVAVNPRWAGFKAADYREASMCVCESPTAAGPIKIEVRPGDFDLRGFEVARFQFFQITGMPHITISMRGIQFNRVCIQKLDETKFVELLIHPIQKVLAVRPAEESARHNLRWARLSGNGKWMPRTISGAAFIPTLYQLFSWNVEYRYCIRGTCLRNKESAVLLFRWADAQIFIPDMVFGNIRHELLRSAARRAVAAFPALWTDTVGDGWYAHCHSQELAGSDTGGKRQLMAPAEPPVEGSERDFSASDHIADDIQILIPQVRQEGAADGG